MGARSSSLRTKIVALLVSLSALWVFAAWVTTRDGMNLLLLQTLNNGVYQPSSPLLLELQFERRLSVTYLAKPSEPQRTALDGSRQRTERLVATFKESARDWQVETAGSAALDSRIREALAKLDGLAAVRSSVDNRSLDRPAAIRAYTDVVDALFGVYGALGVLDDESLARDSDNLTRVNQARELAAQEDALVAGVLAAGRMTEAEYTQFSQLVGAQRFVAADAAAKMPGTLQARFEQMRSSPEIVRFRNLEDRLIIDGRSARPLPVDPVDWRNAAEAALEQMHQVVLAGADAIEERATPMAIGVIIRLLLAAGLGLLAVIASIVVSITTARALVRQLERLREAARQLAEERLPGVVARLGRGEDVDVAAEAPPLAFGEDEIGQVGQAFNAVQETAVRTAVEQAELRRNVRDVFLSIARRSQALVHRQLTLLDTMERREQNAEDLEDLFRVDHLATRMRRNAENLIVLSGSTPGRAWRRNVPMVDVARGAVAEVEDYTRVTVLPFGPVSLAGRAVGDTIHLLAELIENALSFSPPHTAVEVKGQLVGNGYVIEVEDRGLGMSEEDLAAANVQVNNRSAEFNLANAARLGLFVVSRLTERHGIRVQLKESPYGGTTAVVLIPAELVSDGSTDGDTSGGFLAGRTATAPRAGHADESVRAVRAP
ncbi:nitrate- and nitrite sensing domain-containing protein, partial [Micromonospora zhanjiangensis]